MSPRIILPLWLGPCYSFAAAHPILFTIAAIVVLGLATVLGELLAKILINLIGAAGIVLFIGGVCLWDGMRALWDEKRPWKHKPRQPQAEPKTKKQPKR